MNYNIINMSVGIYCKRWRKNHNYTVDQVASDTGLSVSMVSMYENGLRTSSVLLMWYLVHGLKVDKLIAFCEKYQDLREQLEFESACDLDWEDE